VENQLGNPVYQSFVELAMRRLTRGKRGEKGTCGGTQRREMPRKIQLENIAAREIRTFEQLSFMQRFTHSDNGKGFWLGS
jgi:hypothetical protein